MVVRRRRKLNCWGYFFFVLACSIIFSWDVMIKRFVTTIVTYLIFVIFLTLAKFLENKIYTKKSQFFTSNL